MSETVYRYIRHHEVEKWEAVGWEHADPLDGTPHGEWSVLMYWPHKRPAEEPDTRFMGFSGTNE